MKKIAYWLAMAGALNWGLIGVGYFLDKDWNAINWLLGSWPSLEYALYVLVGVAAVKLVLWHRK